MSLRVAAGVCLAAMLTLAGCASTSDHNDVKRTMPMKLGGRQIVAAIPVSPNTTVTDLIAELAQQNGVSVMSDFPLESIGVRCAVFMAPTNVDMSAVIAKLESDPRVAFAQPNRAFETFANAAPYDAIRYAPRELGAGELHRWTTGRGVRIAVIDTGADRRHPALRGARIVAKDFVQREQLGFDDDRHGTAVVGVLSARSHTGSNAWGLAPDAEVLAIKACSQSQPQSDKARCSSWTIAQAIDYAMEADASIINLSLGGPPDRLIATLLKEAERRQILTVAAAGEASSEAEAFPASLKSVIGVIASNVRGEFSAPVWVARSALVMMAPGEDVITLSPGGGYELRSGSSLASAHVAGLLALLLDARAGVSALEVRETLFGTGRAISVDAKRTAAYITRPDGIAAFHKLRMTY